MRISDMLWGAAAAPRLRLLAAHLCSVTSNVCSVACEVQGESMSQGKLFAAAGGVQCSIHASETRNVLEGHNLCISGWSSMLARIHVLCCGCILFGQNRFPPSVRSGLIQTCVLRAQEAAL